MMSNIGAKYVPPTLKEPVVNAMTTQVVGKSLRKDGSLFPELVPSVKVRTGGFNYAALLKPKDMPTEDKSAFAEINVINDAICLSCHTKHGVCVVDVSKEGVYVRDPYYKGRGRWVQRPPTAMKKRTLFEDVVEDESVLEGYDSFIEELSVDSDSGSEPYEYDE
jgi:hypothetical protein